MGNRRHLREAFFKANPWWCFCGGSTLATQEDHIPARSMFRRREWPSGDVFPACAPCNRSSAIDALAMAWLARVTIHDLDAEAEAEMARCLAQLQDRRPDWVLGMQELSRVEVRRQRLQRIGQRHAGDAVFGDQATLQRLAEPAVEQLALQRGRHRLIAGPELGAGAVEDVRSV